MIKDIQARIILFILIVCLIISGGCKGRNYSVNKPENVEQFFAEVDKRHQDFRDEHNKLLRQFARKEKKVTDKKLIRYYEQYKVEKKEMLNKELQVLNSYNFAKLTEDQRINAKTVKWGLQMQQEEIKYYDNNFLVPKAVRLMNSLRDFDIKNKDDIDKYFAELNQFKVRFILDKALIKKKEEQGNLVSQPIIKNVMKQCQRFIAMKDVVNFQINRTKIIRLN
jgi:uncharacterized protein (DUF885 family)